jgi:uncharacterized membrane protein YidH (DUF202 family)
MKKHIKILIDICMILLLILLFPTAKINPTLHIILGFVFIPVAVIHLMLNGKWILSTIKNIFAGKLNHKTSYMFALAVGLMIAFSVCIYTGIAIYRSDFYTPYHVSRRILDPSIHFIYRLHGMSAIACVVLTVLHAKVHWNYLKKAFSKKNNVDK